MATPIPIRAARPVDITTKLALAAQQEVTLQGITDPVAAMACGMAMMLAIAAIEPHEHARLVEAVRRMDLDDAAPDDDLDRLLVAVRPS
jgi:hypothetical protein